MDDKKESTTSETIAGARYVDPRPTNLQIFYELLPGVLGSLAGKSTDARSANAMAFVTVREALGQCAAMGILRLTVQCTDGMPLATMPQNMPSAPGVQAPTQYQPNGAGQGYSQVPQYPNQPGQGQAGMGGVVQQYPNYPSTGGVQGPQSPSGNKGVLVAMFPNGTTPPQL